MDAQRSAQTPAAPGGTVPTGAEGAAMGGGPPGAPGIHPLGEPVPAPAPPADAPSLPIAIAKVWRTQADVMVQRIFMDTQALFGVSAIPPDVVTLKTIVLTLSDALERGDRGNFLYAFGRNSREVSAQINDQTIPYLPGIQIGGHIEGVLRDTARRAFRADPAQDEAAQLLLDEWFSAAYPALLGEPRTLMQPLAPRA